MGNCKDCKFWESYQSMFGGKNWTECSFVGNVDSANMPVDEDSFSVFANCDDDSGLNSGLLTGPMFGCIKFQQKET